MKIKLSYILVMLGALCASCSDFLDVQPSDRISEGQNFSTVAGFKQALNGIYIDLNASELYGRTLSCEFIEIMAQRYDVGQDNKAALEIMQLDFSGFFRSVKTGKHVGKGLQSYSQHQSYNP